jgi:hypothetical protein
LCKIQKLLRIVPDEQSLTVSDISTVEVDMDCDSSDDSTHTDDSTEFIEGDTQTLIANQRKFIVFESQLDDLFARLKSERGTKI